MTDRPDFRRRNRSATESLLSVAQVLEAVLVFFVALTAYGLRAVSPAPALIGGAVFIAVLVLVGRFVRYRWGIALGWILQGALLATGVVLPVMYGIGAVFVSIWIFCFVKGRQLDRATTAITKEIP